MTTRSRWWLVAAPLLFVTLIRLSTSPPLFWDEGWTLAVARNWVEEGHYGQMLEGKPAPPGLAAAAPVVVPIAASFRLFGIGTWQGRLPGAIFMVLSLLLLSWMAGTLFGRHAATTTLVLTLIVPFPALHPLLLGRQVFAETPMLLWVLAGLAALMASSRSAWRNAAAASGCLTLALLMKIQLLPFMALSLAAASADAALARRRHVALRILVVMLVSVGASQILGLITAAQTPVQGLYGVTAFIPGSAVARQRALLVVVVAGLPTVLALVYWLWQGLPAFDDQPEKRAVAVALYWLVAGWTMWFLVFSVGWERYFFPAMLLSAVFVAAMLDRLGVAAGIRAMLAARSSSKPPSRAILAAGVLCGLAPFAMHAVFTEPASAGAVQRIASYLDSATPGDALIETYESELLFLVHRPCHYPPGEVHVALNRRTYLHVPAPIGYDPLAADPDYVVVGPQAKLWGLYEAALSRGVFALVHNDGPYDVYRRQNGSYDLTGSVQVPDNRSTFR